MPDAARRSYALADARARFRIASENPLKEVALRRILADHPGEPTLIIDQ
jgi:DNA excision repair protein ERCC-3